MHSRHPVRLCHQLDIIRHTVADVQRSVFPRLNTDLQQFEHFLLIHAHAPCDLRQPLVRVIPRLIHDIHVEELLLALEKRVGEFPELFRRDLEDSGAGFMRKCR